MPIHAHWTATANENPCRLSFERISLAIDVKSPGMTGNNLVPGDLLAAALAACTSLALGSDVKRRGLSVQELHVHASHAEGEAIAVITRAIHIVGELSEDEMLDLLRVADECPLHRVLVQRQMASHIKVVTISRLEKPPLP